MSTLVITGAFGRFIKALVASITFGHAGRTYRMLLGAGVKCPYVSDPTEVYGPAAAAAFDLALAKEGALRAGIVAHDIGSPSHAFALYFPGQAVGYQPPWYAEARAALKAVAEDVASQGGRFAALIYPDDALAAAQKAADALTRRQVRLVLPTAQAGRLKCDIQPICYYTLPDGRTVQTTSGPLTIGGVPYLVTAAEVKALSDAGATASLENVIATSANLGLWIGQGKSGVVKLAQPTAELDNTRFDHAAKRVTITFPGWNEPEKVPIGVQHAGAAGLYAAARLWSPKGPVYGATKVWTRAVGEHAGKPENHGLLRSDYLARQKKGATTVDSLLIQNRGHKHDAGHVDYSQALVPTSAVELTAATVATARPHDWARAS